MAEPDLEARPFGSRVSKAQTLGSPTIGMEERGGPQWEERAFCFSGESLGRLVPSSPPPQLNSHHSSLCTNQANEMASSPFPAQTRFPAVGLSQEALLSLSSP